MTTRTTAGTAGGAVPNAGRQADVTVWAAALAALTRGEHLDMSVTSALMADVMAGQADDARLAALLMGLRAKGETVAEVAGMADAMLEHARPLDISEPVVDVVGTGGDGAGTVNVSTGAAIVVAGAGEPVAKHGNRAASSRCGSADVLEALGVDIDPGPGAVADLVRHVGAAFCFAQRFHPAMRHAAPVRRALGFRTVFNLLGPLTNPARPVAMAVGVADAGWAGGLVAGVLARRGTTAIVVRGADGVDELTTTATNDVWVVAGGDVVTARVDTRDLGLPRAGLADLAGSDAPGNAAALRAVLDGRPGPVADVVLVNAATALTAAAAAREGLVAADLAGSLLPRLAEGLERARTSVGSGAAAAVLARWAAATPRTAGAGVTAP